MNSANRGGEKMAFHTIDTDTKYPMNKCYNNWTILFNPESGYEDHTTLKSLTKVNVGSNSDPVGQSVLCDW